MEWSEDRGELIAAMVQMQGQLEHVHKGSVNKHHNYKYATLADILEACRQPLHDAGLAVMQTTHRGDHGLELLTTLAHTSGQWIQCRLPLLAIQDPHALGSSLTYARKYGLLTIVGLAADDDDGQAALERGQRAPQQQRQQAQRQRPLQVQAQGAPRGRPQQQQAQQRQQQAQAQAQAQQPQRQQQAPAQTKAAPQPEASARPSPEEQWRRLILDTRNEGELASLWDTFAKQVPKGHPLREALHTTWSKHRTGLEMSAAQARQRDPGWAGD